MGDIARVTEITSRSPKSFEDAVKTGLARADATLRNVEGAWIKEQKVALRDGKIESYQVDMLVTFVLDDDESVASSA
jgi:flavin-binding protein dodecin